MFPWDYLFFVNNEVKVPSDLFTTSISYVLQDDIKRDEKQNT